MEIVQIRVRTRIQFILVNARKDIPMEIHSLVFYNLSGISVALFSTMDDVKQETLERLITVENEE